MSDKNKDRDTSTATNTDSTDAPRASTLSIAPAMDLSLDAVTVPPPPVSGGPALSIPRAPRLPTENKAATPAKKKRSEDDIFSIFDVEANTASDDIPVSVQTFDKKPEPAPVKPKSQLGSRSEEREVTRSRQIPIDQDLFNLSVGLFSSSEKSTLVAPDMSALSAAGLPDGAPTKEPSKSTLDALLPDIPALPVAPLDSVELLAATKSSVPEAPKPQSAKSHRGILFMGIAATLLVAGGAFMYMQKSADPAEATVAAQTATTSNESALDTRPGQPAQAEEARAGTSATDKPKDDSAALAKPATTTASGSSPNTAGDKPTTPAVDTGKQAAQGKPTEAESAVKPTEPEAPAGPSKTQSLAEAMAAAERAPAPPPPSNEFNKSAANSALNGAAGAASGCKAPGDPSGVARVSVTFAPSGRATRAVVNGPPFGGTATGSCVAAAFRSLSVPAFSGDPVTVSKSVSIR